MWAAQRLPPATGLVGPAEGPVVHQFEGAFAPLEAGMLAVQRAVAADVDARAMILTGRRASGLLRQEASTSATPTPKLGELLVSLGVWVGGPEGRGWDDDPRRPEVQRIAGRLAHMGAIAVRDVSLRICPACAMARSPEMLVYREEDGQTLLVRFPFSTGDRPVSALVWTDAAWRLLGTSVLMVHPDLPYVIARYQRRGSEEFVFTSKSSLARIREWLPGADFEVVEEHPGRHWEGQAYLHPLRHEFPMGGSMDPPAGTIVAVADVSDSGTGVVPLVPGHGGTDTQIADRLGVPGWPLVTPKGRFDVLIVHKYAGLELESATEFAERDLAEGGAIFARLQVRRGVPHCARCGTALIWAPGRAWCLEPSRLPADKVSVYRSLLPNDRPIEQLEAVPWPVSEPQRSEDPLAIALLECTSCDRLEAPGLESQRCTCGGRRRSVRRRLLPAFDAAVSAWGSADPFPSADSVRLYVSERRRAPALVHHIAAMSGVVGTPGEVRLSVLPTVPEADFSALLAAHGADAVRCALVRAQASEGATATFSERCAQESRRLEAFWRVTRDVLARIETGSLSTYRQPIVSSLGELEPEDRALLARFERMRIQCLVDFDRSAPGLVHRRLLQFVENDLDLYRRWVAPRLAADGPVVSKRAALRTLVHTVRGATLLLGPIAPFLAESVHRALNRGGASLFEEAALGVDRSLLDENRTKSWDRWVTIVRSVERTRRRAGVPGGVELPMIVLQVDSDAVGAELRAEAPTIARLVRAAKVEVGSPAGPWSGRRRQLRPRESEIQRVYASRATQIIHLLKRMPERKSVDLGSPQGFTVVLNGQPTQILPSMVEWVETLPERFVPSPWGGGEMYLELPSSSLAGPPAPPPLSPDGFRLVGRVAQRLRSRPAASQPAVIVAATGGLAAELAAVAVPLAKYLDVSEFRVVDSDDELPRSGRGYGRTKGGQGWSFHISGLPPASPKRKVRPGHVRGARLRPAFAPGELAPPVTDFAAEDRVAREASVRSLGEDLDRILGAPLLGPAKVGLAWEAGLRSVDSYREAPWADLAALPGFGPPLATALVTKFGGTVPAPPPRVRRPTADATHGHGSSEARRPAPEAGSPSVPATSSPPAPETAPPSSMARAAPTPGPVTTDSGPEPAAVEGVAEPPPPLAPVEPVAGPPAAEIEVESSGPLSDTDREPSVGPEPPVSSRSEVEIPPEPPESGAEAEIAEIPPAPAEIPLPEENPPSVESGRPDDPALDEEPMVGRAVSPADVEPALESPTTAPPESAPPVPGPTVPLGEAESPTAGDGLEAPTIPEAVPPAVATGPRDELTEGAPTAPTFPASPPNESPEVSAGSPTARSTVPDASQSGPAPIPPTPGVSEPEVQTEAAIPEPLGPVATSPPADETPGPPPPEEAAASEPTETTPVPIESSDSPVPPAVHEPPAPDETGDGAAHAAGPPDIPAPPEPSPEMLPTEPPRVPDRVPPAPDVPAAPELEHTPPMMVEPTVAPELAASASPVTGSVSEAAPPVEFPSPPPTPTGGLDVTFGPSYLPALERFLEATAAGHRGICIVRDSPERVRAYIGSRPVELRWLSNIGRGATLKPNDLEGLAAFLAHAVSEGQVTAFFLEGVEYLIRIHGLEKVVERLSEFDREAKEHSARVWVPLNPKLLSPAELERLGAVFGGPPASG